MYTYVTHIHNNNMCMLCTYNDGNKISVYARTHTIAVNCCVPVFVSMLYVSVSTSYNAVCDCLHLTTAVATTDRPQVTDYIFLLSKHSSAECTSNKSSSNSSNNTTKWDPRSVLRIVAR
jgi:hypothetical protein